MEAMLYALDEINADPMLLPNIRLFVNTKEKEISQNLNSRCKNSENQDNDGVL